MKGNNGMENPKVYSSRKIKPTFSLTIIQCIACAVVLLLALIFRLIGGTTFDTLRTLLKNALTDTTFVESVVQKFTQAENNGVGGADIMLSAIEITRLPETVSTTDFSALTTPVLPLATGTVSSFFGVRDNPITGETGFHTGVDIAAPKGTAIVAVYDGTVTRASYDKSYGNYLIIQHADGVQTLYAHCSALEKSVGDTVSAGETVATVGSTGASTGNHLHWELTQNGIYYDPAVLLPSTFYD